MNQTGDGSMDVHADAADTRDQALAAVANARDYLRSSSLLINEAIDALLDRYGVPQTLLHESMRYSLHAGGKRIRPALVLASCAACGGDEHAAVPAAAAIEMVHTFSLIHDDLPGMDDDDMRRGQPTNHKVFGEAVAILAGDGLLTMAFAVLAGEYDDPTVTGSLVRELSYATGARGIIGGQAFDVSFGTYDGPDRLERITAIHEAKTAALIRGACRMGAICARADEARYAMMDRFGQATGLAFQVADDLLDATGTADELGKQVGKDEAAGKPSYAVEAGVDAARRRADELRKNALEALEGLDDTSAVVLRGLAELMVNRRN